MHTSRAISLAAAIGLALVGCKSKKEGAAAGSGAAGSGAASGSSAAGSAGAGSAPAIVEGGVAAAMPVDEAAVKKVVDAWLAAQNTGDFAAYQALYADKMEGVKRVGPRTWRYDRKGWLDDRARMFKNPMKVEARDLTVRGTALGPSVELVQSFSQGKFSDEGPKQLSLIKTPAGYRIAREEMLRSVVAGAAPATGASTIFLVVEVDGKSHVVIRGEAEAAWGKGAIAGPFAGMHRYAMQDASAAPPAATWRGRALAVYGADGKRCDATVGTVRLLSGGSPHFGEIQGWDNEMDMGDGHVWSQAERARAIFDMATPYLVGELAITGDCKPVIAADAAATPKVFAHAAADPAQAEAARAAFRKLPAYKDIQTEFTGNWSGTAAWTASPSVDVFGDYVVVSASEGSGCGDFFGELVAVFKNTGGTLALVSDPADGFLRVDAIVDADGDGKPELIGAINDFRMVTAHLTPKAGAGFAPAVEVTFPYNDCGC